ncbi:MAG: glycosyltransferase family protein [Acidobacteria bacterium]|nr:glycosyltransferase family protein [Acidobacteriota bacterium]
MPTSPDAHAKSALKVLAILQARASSSRLPGKVLKPILGRPMLIHELERARRAHALDAVIVATSDDPSDDAIEALCATAGVGCFRGSLHDVLDRFYQAARPFRPELVVRLLGDCPLLDPELIDRVVAFQRAGKFDLAGAEMTMFPDGLDLDVIPFAVLEEAWRSAVRPSDREHVSLFITRQPERYRVGLLKNDVDLSHHRWTVDEPEDFEMVRRIYEALYPSNPAFTTRDILNLLAARPELYQLNRKFRRNEGLERSLAQDPKEE